MDTIAHQWAKYEAQHLRPGAGISERQALRRVYYAGARGMLRLQIELAGGELSDAQALALVRGWFLELDAVCGDPAIGAAWEEKCGF